MLHYTYLLLFALCVVAVAARIRRSGGCKPWHSLHYAFLVLVASHGLLSLLFAYAGIYLSLELLGAAMLIMLVASLWVTVDVEGTVAADVSAPRLFCPDSSPYWTAWITSVCIGVMFFTPELVPSSMTGDPPRHFLGALEFASLDVPMAAVANKPIYHLMAGLFLGIGLPLEADQAFVLFNIGIFGLSVSSCIVFVDTVFADLRLPERFLTILLVSLGYHFFALQYGYYVLLLSSAFLFSSVAVLAEYDRQGRVFLLGLACTLAAGTTLTHSFLLPELFTSLVGILVLRCGVGSAGWTAELKRFAPYLLTLIAVALASNVVLLERSNLAKFASTSGFVDPDQMINLVPFIPASILYFLLFRRERKIGVLAAVVLAAAAFTYAMSVLQDNGLASPYYVNRNQIVLLPLLSFLAIGLVSHLRSGMPATGLVLTSVLAVLLVLPYLTSTRLPFPMAAGRHDRVFLGSLLKGDDIVFHKNALTVSYSPLQMTGRDRAALIRIGKGESGCLIPGTRRMLVLGTDHQVIWFGIYLGIQPSLARQDEMYVDPAGYVKDFGRWKMDQSILQVAVIKHLNYVIPKAGLNYVRASTKLICEGDSFAIYEKTPRVTPDSISAL
jgi:hypothetical protein